MNTRNLSSGVNKSEIEKANELYKNGNIVAAREAFDKIVSKLEANPVAVKTVDDKKLFIDAYMGRGLAYMVGSALHGPKALENFDRAIELDPGNQLARQKKKELEFELGVTLEQIRANKQG